MDCIVHRVAKSWTRLSDFHSLIEALDICFFSITGQDIDLDYCDAEWFALETNRDHSVIFEFASKYCILDSFVDCDGYSISSQHYRLIILCPAPWRQVFHFGIVADSVNFLYISKIGHSFQ